MHSQTPALRALAERWSGAAPAERANAQTYLSELAVALGVEPPMPAGLGDYQYEYPVATVDRRTGKESRNFIDLYKRDHFILEAKHAGGADTADRVLRAAYAQAKGYASDIPHAPPPFLMVMDVARTLVVWDRWSGTYGGPALGRRFDLRTLAERGDDVDFLRAVWENPASLDPRGRAAAVTRDVAERLAELSRALEGRGLEPERVATFLIRCVFTMFAEDVGLLHGELFKRAIERYGDRPEEFAEAMGELWRAMDVGGRFGMDRILRFNGHFFARAEVLPLTRAELATLLEASRKDWSLVEPTIFGTLLTRALDPAERHRLGAEYTPRAYVERVVRQTVEVPIRERWAPVLAEVLQLGASKRKRDRETALGRLRDFHAWMRGLRFLDPACGSGNFLYVTLHAVKRIELEVLHEIAELTGNPELGLDEVGPRQFHGIEVKPWAREIAELTLWIGYHQFWQEHHKGTNPPEPVLEDTGTLVQRDAVLAWDEIVEVPEKSRPDPTPRIKHPVTGKLVPDPQARLPYYEYRGARQAEWPQADFIVGNPPYLGQARMREAFGDGYVDALRAAYSELPPSVDFVMYWWHRSAEAVAAGRTARAGLITTNTITQKQNRGLIADAAEHGAHVVWAIPDHPWIDEAGSAAVRVAMTVTARNSAGAALLRVDDSAYVRSEKLAERLNADLSAHADVAGAAALALVSNRGLATRGFMLFGAGFILPETEAQALLASDDLHRKIIKHYRNGKDITSRPRGVFVLDFGLMDEEEARQYPVLFDLVRARVKPDRDANSREGRRRYWWRFGEPNQQFRAATANLPRYIATAETAKHRFFQFFGGDVAPDNMLVCIASADALHLGVLSSDLHVAWALAAGGRLGVGNDPRYNKSLCFDPFPFPDPTRELRAQIADVAERLDRHRKDALARDERVTMTGMYNVVEKLRTGADLTPKERTLHEIAACGILRDLHDELDALVARAYGWPWPMEREEILERLVALHDERVAEERAGRVRWLRPDYQVPRFGRGEDTAPAPELALPQDEAAPAAAPEPRPWPAGTVEQIAALLALLSAGPVTAAEAAAAFPGARAELVRRHLETLVLTGEARPAGEHRYAPVPEPV